MTTTSRRILLVTHVGRPEASSCRRRRHPAHRLRCRGVRPRRRARRHAPGRGRRVWRRPRPPTRPTDPTRWPRAASSSACSAATARSCAGPSCPAGRGVPLLGVNLGHVGFLAEAEREDLDATVERIVAARLHGRGADDPRGARLRGRRTVFARWALNEVTVEKAARERMLELTVEIDGRPLSTWGCDGVVMATPTGSTAYAFSAGGPVVWPEWRPCSSCRSAPTPCSPARSSSAPSRGSSSRCSRARRARGVVWCDGRRAVDLPPGARIEVQPLRPPVRLARLSAGGFTDRLVEKFRLPVQGWRGAARRAGRARRRPGVIEEIRIRDLGVIDDAVLPAAPGLTVLTGETGAGKTMVVTGLGPAPRRARRLRARARRRRPGRRRGRARRSPRATPPSCVRPRPAPTSSDGLVSCARWRPTAARGPTSAAGPRRSGCSPSSPSTSSRCTARPTSGGCAAPTSTARRSTRSAVRPSPPPRGLPRPPRPS